MISLDDARQIITEFVSVLPAVRIVLEESFGAVLAEDVQADADYPSADRSMMDGYIVRADAAPGKFRITGEIAAADISIISLKQGEAMRIFTGATLPPGGGRVIMQEECTRNGETVDIPLFPESILIRPRASEAKMGDVALRKGTRIGATEMAILAQVGCVNPSVVRKPIVKHLATGDELVTPTEQPAPGKIRDTNSSLLVGLLAPFGLSMSTIRIADDQKAMREATEDEWDLLLISGGASVGDHDHGAEVLRSSGFTIHLDKVNLRPGKPLTFATRGDQVAFVIPGNPVSHFACFHVAIRLAVELLSGLVPRWDFIDLEISNQELIKPNPRETFWPARVSASGGRLVAEAQKWSTSGDTFSISGTNALIRVSADFPPLTLLLDQPHPNRPM